MQNSVSAYLITLIRKIKDNSRIDLVVERLSSRLVIEVDANSRFRFRGQLGSAKSGANLALSRADHQFLNFPRSEEFHSSTILNEGILFPLARRHEGILILLNSR